MSKNKVALGIASAVIGFTGVAGASVAVSQHTTSDDHGHQASISADADGLSFDGSAGALAGLPGLPDVNGIVNTATGLAGTDVVGTAMGAVGSAQEIADGALATATGLLPVGLPGIGSLGTCAAGALPTSLPVPVALPANTMKAILGQLSQVESLANMVSGLTAGLPVKFPALLSASDVFATIRAQGSCAASLAGQPSAVPAACDITAGLPVALPEPVAGAVADVANMAGQKISMTGETGLGLSCNSNAATSAVSSIASNPGNVLSSVQGSVNKVAPKVALPKVDLPALPAIPAIPGVGGGLPAVPDVSGVVDTVTGVVGSVQNVVGGAAGGALPNLVDLNGILNGILPSSCTAGASGGLLGSLTAVLSANCS